MESVRAKTFVEVAAVCPYCGAFDDILDSYGIIESLGYDHRASGCDVEIECSECEKTYLVTDIDY